MTDFLTAVLLVEAVRLLGLSAILALGWAILEKLGD
jgi:hypothetical protein